MKKYLYYTLFIVSLILLLLLGQIVSKPANATTQSAFATVVSGDEVYVPAGAFAMGCASDFSSVKCDADASPIHLVYLEAFYIDRTEVSNKAYAACVTAGACPSPLSTESDSRPKYYDNPTYENYPVIYVDWNRAAAYCNWRGKRLPTEAEWEKAARGTDLRWFPWGNEIPDCSKANIARLDDSACLGDTTPVDSFSNSASPYGAINMVGNVREWVNDLYESKYYDNTPYRNPLGPTVTDKGEHLVRGGSWIDHIDGGSNAWVRIDESGIHHLAAIGFRCAHSAPIAPTPTPTSTPTPTPLPSDSGHFGVEGGVLWIAYPEHLTAVHVPPGALTETMTLEIAPSVTYTEPQSAGNLYGMDHFFVVDGVQPSKPLEVLLGFKNSRGVIAGTEGLYRLDADAWITDNITTTEHSSGHILAWIDQPGLYGILGQTNRTYLPLVLKR